MAFSQEIIQGPLLELWETTVAYLPNLIGAVLIFLIGVIVALVLRGVVVKVIALLRIDELAKRLEITSQFERIGLRLHIGALIGWIIKWFVIIIALIAATDILGWDQVTAYLAQVVLFIPNVIIANPAISIMLYNIFASIIACGLAIV